MEVAANVALLDEVGEIPVEGGVDFAVVLAHLRRDERQAERFVHAGFRLAGDFLADSLARIRVVHVAYIEHAVLVHLVSLFDGVVPQGDVVVLASGEILKRAAELLWDDDSQVDAHVRDADGRFVGARLDDFGRSLPLRERLDNRFFLVFLAFGENVDIADGFAPAPQRPGEFVSPGGRNLVEESEHLVTNWSGVAEQFPPANRSGELDAVEDVLLRFGSVPLEFPNLFLAGGLL